MSTTLTSPVADGRAAAVPAPPAPAAEGRSTLAGLWARRPEVSLQAFVRRLRDPLYFNGYALALSAGLTAVIGVAYWSVAGHRYEPAQVGRNVTAIFAMMFLGGVAQLNLASALVRFVPNAGERTLRLVGWSYAVSALFAAVLSTGFLLLVPTIAPALDFLQTTPLAGTGFALAVVAWAIFALQDGALTGLRRAGVVPIENGVFSVVKVALVVAMAGAFAGDGILLSWSITTAAAVVATNAYIFLRAIPRHQALPASSAPVTLADLRRFVPKDFFGYVFSLGATTLLPVLIIPKNDSVGAAAFYFAWVMSSCLNLVSIGLGSSFVVESAALDRASLQDRCWRVMRHLASIVVPAALALTAAAPLVLRIFGHRYGAAGTGTMRWLALSTIPYVVTSTAIAVARSRRRTGVVLAINAALTALVYLMSWILQPHLDVQGIGVAWLVAQVATAAVLLVFRRPWLGPPERVPAP